jgi:hypothetical protein
VLTGRLGKWALLMSEFDITFVPQKSVKGQALADFLAAHPVPDDSPLITDLLDEKRSSPRSLKPHGSFTSMEPHT